MQLLSPSPQPLSHDLQGRGLNLSISRKHCRWFKVWNVLLQKGPHPWSTQDPSWKKPSSIPRLQHYLPLLCEEHHWPPPRCVLTIPHIQLANSYFKVLLLFLETSLLSKFECVLICEINCIEYPLSWLCVLEFMTTCNMWFRPSGSSKFLQELPALRLCRKIRQ